MKISDTDLELIDKLDSIMQRGYYADGKEVTEIYNRVFEQRLTPTNCSSCLRHRISKLAQAKRTYLAQLEKEAEKEKERKEETNGTTTSKGSDERKERKGRSKKAAADK